MTTVEKGDAFENLVHQQFEQELRSEKLHVSSSTSTLFKKKSYFSRDRGKNIVFDLSIETWLPGAVEYSLLTLIECKDYSKAIPVDDVEEFHSKVRQVTGTNVKAIFVTNSSLQSGALQYARSNKIALVRLLPSNQIQWEMHYSLPNAFENTINANEFQKAFLNADHISKRGSFYGLNEELIYGDLRSLLDNILK